MKNGSFSYILFFPLIAAFAPASSYAQNYVDARNYSTANVVVDLTVLDNGDYMFSDMQPQRITPSPALRGGIRTPGGIVSRSGISIADAAPSMPMPPTIDRVIMKQDLSAPVTSILTDAAAENSSAEEIAENLSSTAPAAVIMQKPASAAPISVTEQTDPLPVPAPVQRASSVATEIKVAMAKPATPETDEISAPSDISEQVSGAVISLVFSSENATLPTDSESKLSDLATSMKSNPERRIQIKAFASGTPETANRARRLSLTRALNARTFLLQKGVRATQIDVRALGIGNAMDNPSRGGAPVDRIDFIVTE